MLAILLPCGGGPDIPILEPRVVVGRGSECDVAVPYKTVSGRHCEMELVNGYWRVRDLGSSNGTRVNGVAAGVSWVLPDDELALGKERFFLIYIPPEGSSPPPRTTAGVGRKPPGPATPGRRTAARAWTLGELVPCGGGESIPLLKANVVVGRAAECDVVLNFNDVSTRHCRLDFSLGHWFVNDLGSRNGTRVDNQRCTGPTPVLPESVLAVARHRFRVLYTPAAEPGEAEDPFARGLLEKAGLEDWAEDLEEEP